ncbi:MAG: GDP-L-fucose synthase [Kiritimatiellales bacterium]|nr:GDP-L-fucose synthase [Kiritimatiellota bacterium]MBL7016171.1 GDP-L-fucose synthase [Kiritimatiellales bacterium]
MDCNSKVYIAGHLGLVGGGIWRAFERHGYTNLIGRSIDEVNLINQQEVEEFFAVEKPEVVVLVAAKVGGIHANDTYRGQFIYENMMIEMNVIHAAKEHGVKKLLFLGSSCIYPKLAEQPLKEESLLTGPLEPTNEPYAIAKIAGIRLCDAYNRQYGTNFISAMPTNMYGPGDNYHPENSHVLPAMIRKVHLAKSLEASDFDELRRVFDFENRRVESGTLDVGSKNTSHIPHPTSHEHIFQWLEDSGIIPSTSDIPHPTERSVTLALWGSGTPLREFLYSDDLAEACVFLVENGEYKDMAFTDDSGTVQSHINVGSGKEVTIKELAETVKEVIGFEGELAWDSTKPDGTPRKLMDSSRINALGWTPKVSLKEGIAKAYADFLTRF